MRSSSFDEFQLEANRTSNKLDHQQLSTDESPAALLQVPHLQFSTQRSRSVESGSIDSIMASYLEVPKRFQRRRSSNTKSPVPCVHCLYLEEREKWLESGGTEARSVGIAAANAAAAAVNERRGSSQSDEHHQFSDTSSISDDDDDDNDDDDNDDGDDDTDESENIDKHHLNIPHPHCNIKFSLSPTTDAFPLQSQSAYDPDDVLSSTPPHTSSTDETQCDKISPTPTIDIELPAQLANRGRRRSISRQEAVFIEPTGNSLENLDSMKSPTDEAADATATEHAQQLRALQLRRHNEKLSTSDSSDYVQDYYLTVPETDLRRDRAASVDSSFSKLSSNGKTEELQPEIDGFLTVPTNAVRSRSVDIVLPTNEQARYKALALASPSMSKRYVIHATLHSSFPVTHIYKSKHVKRDSTYTHTMTLLFHS